MRKHELPEEKLLDLIKKRSAQDEKLETAFKYKRSLFYLHKNFRKLFSSKTMSYILALACTALILFIFALLSWKPLDDLYLQNSKTGPALENIVYTDNTLAELDIYTRLAQEKNIFKLSERTGSGQGFDALAEDLILLGVITEEPKQAIIKDIKNDKTFFLEIGDSFSGLRVVGIREGVVEIEVDGAIKELQL